MLCWERENTRSKWTFRGSHRKCSVKKRCSLKFHKFPRKTPFLKNICERLLLNLKNAPEKFSNCCSFTKVNIDQTFNFSDFRKSMPVRISVFPCRQTTCVSTGLKYLVNNQSLFILSLLNNEVFGVKFPSFYDYRLFFIKQQFCWLSAVKSRWYRYSTYGSIPFFIEISP